MVLRLERTRGGRVGVPGSSIPGDHGGGRKQMSRVPRAAIIVSLNVFLLGQTFAG